MNTNDFYAKYNGKGLDFDNVNGNQCVDVIKAWFRHILGIEPLRGNAIDYWRDIPGFERIAKNIFNAPQPNDIVIWSATPSNPYGHIGICAWSRTFDFSCFEQNFPVGSVCHFQEHNYKGVIGWLRPKIKPVQTPVKPLVGPWHASTTVVGTPIPLLAQEVLKWSSGDIILDVKTIPLDLPYNPVKDYSGYARDRFCFISCNPAPEIYKTTISNDMNTAYAIVGNDARTASYEFSHMLHKYYLAHRGSNPFIEIKDTVGNVTDSERIEKYNVLKPYLTSVILK